MWRASALALTIVALLVVGSVTLANPDPPLITPQGIDLVLGPADSPEVNLDDLKVGPRGWIFGATEENGYMFIHDPRTGQSHAWNAGRTAITLAGRPDEGGITDFEVWEDNGRLIILVAQQHPADLFRYEIEIPAVGLPLVQPSHGVLVYENLAWARVGSVKRGRDSGGQPLLLAGSVLRGSLIASVDEGFTWTPVNYADHIDGIPGAVFRAAMIKNSSFTRIDYVNGTWILFTSSFARLASDSSTSSSPAHFLNALLISRDGARTWSVARIERNPLLPNAVRDLIAEDRALDRLPSNFYGLYGERVHNLTALGDGRLMMTTAMNNTPAAPYGGRLLLSTDDAATWRQVHHFTALRNVTVVAVPGQGAEPDLLLAGTSTKTKVLPPDGRAVGELLTSADGGRSFSFWRRIVASQVPSSVRPEYWVVGALALAATEDLVAIGTVNEGARARLFTAARYRDQAVTWSRGIRVSESNGTLTKDAAAPPGWNAGAVSTRGIARGNGLVTFTAAGARASRAVGLSHGNATPGLSDLDFAIFLHQDGRVRIYESGEWRGDVGRYAEGDTFTIAIVAGVVEYRQNGRLLHSSSTPPVYPLLVDTSFHTPGGQISSVAVKGQLVTLVAPIVWTHISGAISTADVLTSTAPTGDAISTAALLAGEGAVEFVATETTSSRMIGLGPGELPLRWRDLAFALHLHSDGRVRIRESGLWRGEFGRYATGDVFTIAVSRGTVQYFKNNVLLYRSGVPPSLPLVVQASLLSHGATVAAPLLFRAER